MKREEKRERERGKKWIHSSISQFVLTPSVSIWTIWNVFNLHLITVCDLNWTLPTSCEFSMAICYRDMITMVLVSLSSYLFFWLLWKERKAKNSIHFTLCPMTLCILLSTNALSWLCEENGTKRLSPQIERRGWLLLKCILWSEQKMWARSWGRMSTQP